MDVITTSTTSITGGGTAEVIATYSNPGTPSRPLSRPLAPRPGDTAVYPFDLHVQFALDRSRRYEQLATEHRAIATADAEAAAYAAPGLRLSASSSRTPAIRDPASPAAA